MFNLRRIVAALAVLASLTTFAAPASARVPTVTGTLRAPSTNAAWGTFELMPASNSFGFFLCFTLPNGHILTVMPASLSPAGVLECTYIEYMLIGAVSRDGTQGWQWSEVAGGRVTLDGATDTTQKAVAGLVTWGVGDLPSAPMVSAASHTSPVTIKAAVFRSDLGRSKKANEDGVLSMAKVPLWAVADGTGGLEPARIALMTLKDNAAQLAAKNLDVAASPSSASRLAVGRHLEAMFAKANIAVSEAGETMPDRRIATTLCAATIVGQHAFIAHVGDSRAYLFRGGSLRCLTNDHTLAALQLRRGDITAAEFATSPFQRTLSQAIGMSPALEVDLLELRLHPGDKLIVTSNGLNRALPDDTIRRCLLADGDPEDRADLLIQKVNERGAPDNTTFILIEIDGDGRPMPRRDGTPRQSDASSVDTTDRANARAIDLETNVRNCFLFQGLSDTEWLQIQPYIEVLETAPRRAPLCQIGQAALGFCVLANGKIQVDLPGGETRVTGPGEHFGTLALATEGPAQETAVVLEPSLVYVLSKARFAEILRLNPTLGGRLTLSLLESLGNRLGILTARIGQILDAANGRG